MDHIPILRAGEPYTSLDRVQVNHIQSGEPLVEVSQANRGLIGRDLNRAGASKGALEAFSVAELVGMCKGAARLFMEEDLPLGEASQSPEAYVEHLSGTTGMPQALCRKNMEKIRKVLDEIELVLDGLTRGLDLSVLDQGWNQQGGRPLNYVAQTQALGAVLPSNSPGVHALWVPAIPLKVPPSAQAWTGRALDSFSYCPGLYGGGVSAGGLWFLPHRPRRRHRDFVALPALVAFWGGCHG